MSPKLNFDILLLVVREVYLESKQRPYWSLPNSDLCRLMRACRELYNAGVALILRHGVKLTSRPMLAAFTKLMRSDVRRFRHLRRLRIDSHYTARPLFRKDSAQDLLWILSEAKWLETLKLADLDVTNNPVQVAVAAAFQQLSSLTTLELSHWKANSVGLYRDIVWNTPSRIKKLDISFWNQENEDSVDIIPFLEPFAPYLEQLCVRHARIVEPSEVVYPLVTTLTIYNNCDYRNRCALSAAFPNLQVLDLAFGMSLNTDVLESARQSNMEARVCWESLDQLSGHIKDIHTLGINCPVTTARIDVAYAPDIKKTPVRRWREYLKRAMQDMTLTNVFLDLGFHPRLLKSAFQHGGQSLKCIVVRFIILPDETHPLEPFDLIRDALQDISPTYVRLSINWGRPDWMRYSSSAHTVTESLLGMDYHGYALELADAIPSLRHVVFTLNPNASEASYYFHIPERQEKASERSLIVDTLDEIEGRRIQREAESVWPGGSSVPFWF